MKERIPVISSETLKEDCPFEDDGPGKFSIIEEEGRFYLKWEDRDRFLSLNSSLNSVEAALVREIIKLQNGDGKYSVDFFGKLNKK